MTLVGMVVSLPTIKPKTTMIVTNLISPKDLIYEVQFFQNGKLDYTSTVYEEDIFHNINTGFYEVLIPAIEDRNKSKKLKEKSKKVIDECTIATALDLITNQLGETNIPRYLRDNTLDAILEHLRLEIGCDKHENLFVPLIDLCKFCNIKIIGEYEIRTYNPIRLERRW